MSIKWSEYGHTGCGCCLVLLSFCYESLTVAHNSDLFLILVALDTPHLLVQTSFFLILVFPSPGVVNWADRKNVIRFALSAEEIGYLLHQLPDNDVQFSRKQFPPEQQGTVMDDGITETSTEPIKVFRMKSGEAGIVSLSVDYELNGVGGQQLSTVETGQGPMEVTAQLGEFQVIRELMRTSIPLLTGWETLTGVTMQRQMEMTFSGAFNPQTSTYNE